MCCTVESLPFTNPPSFLQNPTCCSTNILSSSFMQRMHQTVVNGLYCYCYSSFYSTVLTFWRVISAVAEKPRGAPYNIIHRVSKNCAKLFLSELRQISHNFSFFTIFLPKIIKIVEIWQSSDENSFAQFFWDTVYIATTWIRFRSSQTST